MRVAVSEVQYLYHLPAVRMRIFPAGTGPVVIHAAMIIGEKKGTGWPDHDIVAVLIDTKVFCNKGGRPHTQALSQAFDISLIEYRARGLAAVGAMQAIGSSKNLLMKVVNGIVELAAVGFLQRVQKLPVFLSPAGGQQSVLL